jgi:hypothetical protein
VKPIGFAKFIFLMGNLSGNFENQKRYLVPLAAYVIWFGTHKEYDKIDVSEVSFDIEILNFKNK